MDWTQTSEKLTALANEARNHELNWFKAYSLLHPWICQAIIAGVGFLLGAWLL